MRLIDAELLWYGLAGIHVRTNGMCKTTELEKLLNNAPTVDAVEVVRCKDCKRYQLDSIFHVGFCGGKRCKDDDFCSYGERKEDET